MDFSKDSVTKMCSERIAVLKTIKNKKDAIRFLKEIIKETKIDENKKRLFSEHPLLIHKNEARENMIKCSEKLPRFKMTRLIKEGIAVKIQCDKLQEKYPEITKILWQEVQEEYELVILRAEISSRIKAPDDEHVKIHPYKNPGKTKNYTKYKSICNELESTLLITQMLYRKILHVCTSELPEKFIDFSEFHNGLHEIETLDEIIKNKISESTIMIKDFTNKLKMIVAEEKFCGLNKKHLSPCLRGATGLVSIHLCNALQNTIKNLVLTTSNETLTPRLRYTFYFEDTFKVDPAMDTLVDFYLKILKKIVSLGENTPCLENYYKKRNDVFVSSFLTDDFLHESSKSIEVNIAKIYEPIEDYKNFLQEEFLDIYTEKDASPRFDVPFDVGCTLVDKYKDILRSLSKKVLNEYYAIGQLVLKNCIDSLKKLAGGFCEEILNQLINQHLYMNDRICETFEIFSVRCTEIPTSAEALMEISAYMAKTVETFLPEMEEKIIDSILINAKLIEMTTLSDDHIKLNVTTVNWLNEIPSLLEKNSGIIEKCKGDFEDKLTQAVDVFNGKVSEVLPFLVLLDNMDDINNTKHYLEKMNPFIISIKKLDEDLAWINNEEATFKFPLSTYAEFDELKKYVYPFYHLLKLCRRWRQKHQVWMYGSFEDLNYSETEKTATAILKELQLLEKTYRAELRQQLADNVPRRFKGSVDDPDPVNLPAPLKLCRFAIQEINDFMPNLVIMKIMCNDALLQRHWDEMSLIAGFNMTPNAGTTLKKIVDSEIKKNIDQFEIISSGAVKEKQLLNTLLEMHADWEKIDFFITFYKDTKIQILSQFDEIQLVLDEHLMKTLAMRGTVFVKPYQNEVKLWHETLNRINETLEECTMVQTMWLRLLPIFSIKDITDKMADENLLFNEIDGTFKKCIATIQKCPSVIKTAGRVGLLEDMKKCLSQLEQVSAGVNKYLEKKRTIFARFFFVSNEDILDVISETETALGVQSHLKKFFNGINRLVFNDKLEATAICSKEYEIVPINAINTESAKGDVEKLLIRVEQEMMISLQSEISTNCKVPKQNTIDCHKKLSGQASLVVASIEWTAKVENAIKNNTLCDLKTKYKKHLSETLDLLKEPSSSLVQLNLQNLIVMKIYMKDTIEVLLDKKVCDVSDFVWLAQLKYYLIEDCNVYIKIINASFKYLYEYYGCIKRLVVTPQTERCFITLTSAFNLHFFCALQGKSGSGKKEMVKDLAKALGVHCVYFHCSSDLDYKLISNYFKGALSLSSWVCFDDFDRISNEVLSVVAHQATNALEIIKAKLTRAVFEDVDLKIKSECFICATVSSGGDFNIPSNLQKKFRPIHLLVPDCQKIAQVILCSHGFSDSRNLSVKITNVLETSAHLLTKSNHYDYGIRTIKQILKRVFYYKNTIDCDCEEVFVLKSITDVFKAKLLKKDFAEFDNIIGDLFPERILPKKDNGDLIKSIHEACSRLNLEPSDGFVSKIVQTHEAMAFRSGIILLGEPLSGKTTVLKTLSRALEPQNISYKFINPKSVSVDQFYGRFSSSSNEWIDGVFTKCLNEFLGDANIDKKWIIFDGPLDSIWAENISSLLDENKKLCLTSGKRIYLTEDIFLIFEVVELTHASPTIVSRCGVIYVDSSTLEMENLVSSSMRKFEQKWCKGNETLIIDLFRWLIPPVLEFVSKNCQKTCRIADGSLINDTIKIVATLLNEACSKSTEKDDQKYTKSWIQATFVYAGIWGLSSNIDQSSQEKFDQFYKTLWRDQNENHRYPNSFEKLEVPLPVDGLLHDYIFYYKQKGVWKYWPEILKNAKIDQADDIHDILVPTFESSRYITLMENLLKNNHPVLLIGENCTGKTTYFKNVLTKRTDQEKIEYTNIPLTVKISPNQLQSLILSKLNKKKFAHYGPPKNKKAIFFIDDINVLEQEKFGAIPTLELIRQFMDHHIWYDLKSFHPIHLQDCQIVATSNLNDKKPCPRFLNNFNVISLNNLSDDCLTKIFSNALFLGFKNNGFPSDIIASTAQLVGMTLEIYSKITFCFKPTPAKIHYVFNIRDIWRVIYGCCLLKKESADDKKILMKIWSHEILRVFHDRLISDADRQILYDALTECLEKNIKEDLKVFFDKESFEHLIFGCYSNEQRRYEEIKDVNQLHDVAVVYSKNKNVVFFRNALENLSKICRILSLPYSSGLLIGINGVGRQTLTKIACGINKYKLYQPKITNNYTTKEWREDLKNILKISGGDGQDVVFLLSESQIKREEFLEDIDCLLKSGQVTNLWKMNEQQEILEMARLAAQGGNRNLDVSAATVFSFFVKECHKKLHIILCFSLNVPLFRNSLKTFTIINYCTVIWFHDWPDEAISLIAKKWIVDANICEKTKENIITSFVHFHTSAKRKSDDFFRETGRKTYITSGLYLELVRSFVELINKKQMDTQRAKERYLLGLEKLLNASNQIVEMQKNLADYQILLKDMTIKAAEMAEQIEKETAEVEIVSDMVKRDEKIANIQAAKAQELKLECEADLAQAIPILEDAISALNTLKPTDITLVKSMKNPPDAIKLVMAAVCVIRDVKPDRIPDPSTGRKTIDYWGPSKRILGDMNFLQNLKDFDKDHIKPDIMVKIRKEYLPHKDFKPHVVAKASSAAEGLCKWIIAMDMYDAVAKEVAPKKENLEAAEKEYATTLAILTEKKEQVTKLEEKLANLNRALEDANKKQQKLQVNVDMCSNKLQRAEKLIGGLSEEKNRWTVNANELQSQYDCLPGDVLLSCGLISYLTAFTDKCRSDAITQWHDFIKKLSIPCSDTYSLISTLGSDLKIQNWHLNGLPKDDHSIQNAVIMDRSKRCPLFIDPQCKANSWIKKFEKPNNCEVTKFSHPDYIEVIQKCVEFGKPCLLENVSEDLKASIDPILTNSVYEDGDQLMIELGSRTVTFHKNFRLYITTKLVNPHFQPDVFNKATIINFKMTLQGLEDQLLDIIVTREKPDLQRRKNNIVNESAKNVAALQKLDDDILKTLSETKGDILENESAIKFLDSSKVLSNNIRLKQKANKEAKELIEGSRLDYKTVAEHSAFLYECTTNLSNINCMYRYSLAWFIKLFTNSIENTNKSRYLDTRLRFLKEAFTYKLYTNIVLSLYEQDKITFSFLLCMKVLSSNKQLDDEEYKFLLLGKEENNLIVNIDWPPYEIWKKIVSLDALEAFKGFSEDFSKNVDFWAKYLEIPEPEILTLPRPWCDLTDFQRLVLIKTVRPDRLICYVKKFIGKILGEKFVTAPLFDISTPFGISSCVHPLIFVLSHDFDPLDILSKFAEIKGYKNKFLTLSLGVDQETLAENLIKRAKISGSWVCLQNCHLVENWLDTLETIWEDTNAQNTNTNFRLWLTTGSTTKFPNSILVNGIKMVVESPFGLKRNILHSYLNEPIKDEDFYSSCPGKDILFTKLLYSITFFHALVKERKRFGTIGWTVPYDFDSVDFWVSLQQLSVFVNEYEHPYDVIKYLVGQCNYGGRISDVWDLRLINAILDDFINKDIAERGNYVISLPKQYDYGVCVQHINCLELNNTAEIFGLHNSANFNRNLKDFEELSRNIILAQEHMRIEFDSFDETSLVTILNDLLLKIPKEIENFSQTVDVGLFKKILVSEIGLMNNLIFNIVVSIKNVLKAVGGLRNFTPSLEVVAKFLKKGDVPEEWLKVSYPTKKNLPNYVGDLNDRVNFFKGWLQSGQPKSYCLPYFFNPQALLVAAKQKYAKDNLVPINRLVLDFGVSKDDSDDDISIIGLYCEGARWDRDKNALGELLLKNLNDPMPPINVNIVLGEELNGRYECPVFRTSSRREYVCAIFLKSNVDTKHWIKRNVALLCEID